MKDLIILFRKATITALMCLLCSIAFAQSHSVTGIVKDVSGEPMIGVNIAVKGTASGTVTDIDGKFSLSNVPEKAILTISFIGYVKQEIAVGEQKSLNVTLVSDSKTLKDVVVVGYGTMKKSDLTGSVTSVTSENFKTGMDLSPQQLMQGTLAGVNVSENSGKPGGSSTIRVRGGTSISASNDPLFVIDGVPISTTVGVGNANLSGNTGKNDYFDQEPSNPLSSINPNDIESINILKDASATAIYGSRGANGVVLITTKKGKAGTEQLNYSYSLGTSNVTKKLDVLTADEYRSEIKSLGLTIDDKGDNANWQDRIFHSASTFNHYLSFMSGNERTNYRASLGYGEQQGIIIGSNMNDANIRMNVIHSALNDKLKIDLRLNYGESYTNQSPISNTVGSEMGTCMLYEAYVFNPTYPIRDSEGNYYNVAPYRVNPVSFSDQVLDKRRVRRLIGDMTATYNFYKPFTFQVNMGYNYDNTNRNSYISKNSLLGNGYGGYVSVQKLEDYSKLLETILKYNQSFGKHNIDAMAGYSYQYFYDDMDRTTAYGFLSDTFKWYSLDAAQSIESISSSAESNKLISMYGRINYNYDDKYLVTATLRRDGSSRFGSGHKWGLFPSAALSWRISKEKFFKCNFVSDLKLRASYGVTGNQEIGNYNSLTTLGASSSGYIVGGNKITIVLPQQYSNPDLKWEQTAQTDFGVDFSLFNSRIRGNVDYYYKRTSDLLLSVAVPSPSLITSQIANVGTVTNKGIEAELGIDVINYKDFSWDANLNASHNKNKVTSLSNGKWTGNNVQVAPCQGQGLSGTYAQLIMEGQPLGTFYGKKFTGVVNGVEQFANNGAKQIIGCAQPKLTFGITNTFRYKQLSLSVMMRGSVGNDVYNAMANNLSYLSYLPGKNVLKRAITDGVSRDQPVTYSSRFIENGSFLRMDNVTLGYDFNVKQLLITKARIYMSAQNLFIITGYKGVDPEVNSEVSRTGIAPLGVDYLSYPKARTFSFGINITF